MWKAHMSFFNKWGDQCSPLQGLSVPASNLSSMSRDGSRTQCCSKNSGRVVHLIAEQAQMVLKKPISWRKNGYHCCWIHKKPIRALSTKPGKDLYDSYHSISDDRMVLPLSLLFRLSSQNASLTFSPLQISRAFLWSPGLYPFSCKTILSSQSGQVILVMEIGAFFYGAWEKSGPAEWFWNPSSWVFFI